MQCHSFRVLEGESIKVLESDFFFYIVTVLQYYSVSMLHACYIVTMIHWYIATVFDCDSFTVMQGSVIVLECSVPLYCPSTDQAGLCATGKIRQNIKFAAF